MCEYYTPKWIFDNLGMHFDVDVCSPPGGSNVPATKYYDIKDDGLTQKWEGLVWCNPPFNECAKWMDRFMRHGHGVALIPVSKTKWFDKLIEMPGVVVKILPSDLKFDCPDGVQRAIRSPCCLVMLFRSP